MYKKTDGREQKQDSSHYCGVDAHYIASALPSHQGNPLIEALPPIYTKEEVSLLLQYDPGYNEQDRQLPAELRLQLIFNSAQFLQPLVNHLELERLLSRMLRSGYLGRNPIEKETLHFSNQKRLYAMAQSCAVIGLSGTGKVLQ